VPNLEGCDHLVVHAGHGCCPGGPRYCSATVGSRTSLTRLPMTVQVMRWVWVERPLRARLSRVTITARVGALTSAMKVVWWKRGP
jgi:hypothetical protein